MVDGQRIKRVAWDESHGWMLFGHRETLTVLEDHKIFSNRASRHLSVPNGMDPPEHTRYRALIEEFFDVSSMTAFEPHCRELVVDLVESLPRDVDLEVVARLGEELALRVQTAFLGWPEHLRERLRRWVHDNRVATRSRDKTATTRVAEDFAVQIAEILDERRRLGADAPDDATTTLLRSQLDGRPLSVDEITSVVRNWTMGEVGTITASVGIIVHDLAAQPDVQDRLRRRLADIPPMLDEILRRDGPLMTNRRVATQDTEVGGQAIAAGDRLTILWPSANRDEAVFAEPERLAPEENAAQNLLYGAGIHVCPGAPLARMQLTMLTEELLARFSRIEASPQSAERAVFPEAGYSSVWVQLR